MTENEMLETCKSALNAAEYLSGLIEKQEERHVRKIVAHWSTSICVLAKCVAGTWAKEHAASLATVHPN